MVNATPRPLYPQERDPVPIVQEAGWAPGLVWKGAEIFAPHRDSIPRPSSPYLVAIPTELPGPQMPYSEDKNPHAPLCCIIRMFYQSFCDSVLCLGLSLQVSRSNFYMHFSSMPFVIHVLPTTNIRGQTVGKLVEALRCKLECSGFDFRRRHGKFSLT